MEYGTNIAAQKLRPEAVSMAFDRKVPARHEFGSAGKQGATSVMAPPQADGILAIDAGVELVACITEGIPVIDMMWVSVNRLSRTYRPIRPTSSRPANAKSDHARYIRCRKCFQCHSAVRDANLRSRLATHPGVVTVNPPATASAAIRSTACRTPGTRSSFPTTTQRPRRYL